MRRVVVRRLGNVAYRYLHTGCALIEHRRNKSKIASPSLSLQSLTPMHVIHARVKFASKGVTRWEAGQQVGARVPACSCGYPVCTWLYVVRPYCVTWGRRGRSS